MIHTTHRKAIEAYQALGRIWNRPFRIKDSRNLMMLRMELEKEAKYHDEEIQKYLHRYNPTPLENGNYQFASVEDKNEFEKVLNDMNNEEVDFVIDPVVIDSTRYNDDDIRLSPSELYQLNDFIVITDGKEN